MCISSPVDKTDPVVKNVMPFVVNFLRQESFWSFLEHSFITCCAERTSEEFLEWSRNETKDKETQEVE